MQNAELESVSCPGCGASEPQLLHRVRDHLFAAAGEFRLVRCGRCRLAYLDPRPTLSALGQYYPSDYFCYGPVMAGGRRTRRAMGGLTGRLARQRIAQLEKHVGAVSRRSRVLDVGCGANAFLYHLHRLRGCDTLGVDFNPAVVAAIGEHLGMPAACGALPELALPEAEFDGVAMYEYLEHEGRPRELLHEARRITRPGGWLVIETPNLASRLARLFGPKWCQLDAPRHLVLFEPATLRRMLADCGYELIALRPLVYQWMAGFSMLVALGFRRMGRLSMADTALGVLAGLPLLPLPWLFPEFMRAYARRK